MKTSTKVKIGIVGAAVAAGTLVNLAVSPEDLVRPDEPEKTAGTVETAAASLPDSITVTEEGSLSAKDALRAQIIRMPLAVRALILLPLWVLGEIPVALGSGIAAAFSAIGGSLLHFGLEAALLIGLFCLVYKLLFPKRPLKELFKKKNFRWLIFGAAAIVTADWALSLAWKQYSVWRVVIIAGVGFGVLALLWHRICGKLPAPKAEPKQVSYDLDFKGLA